METVVNQTEGFMEFSLSLLDYKEVLKELAAKLGSDNPF